MIKSSLSGKHLNALKDQCSAKNQGGVDFHLMLQGQNKKFIIVRN